MAGVLDLIRTDAEAVGDLFAGKFAAGMELVIDLHFDHSLAGTGIARDFVVAVSYESVARAFQAITADYLFAVDS